MERRRKRKVTVLDDVSILGQTTNSELLEESNNYDPENYDPLEETNVENRDEIITIRLSKKENKKLMLLARKKGISKSTFIRMYILDFINSEENISSKISELKELLRENIEQSKLNK